MDAVEVGTGWLPFSRDQLVRKNTFFNNTVDSPCHVNTADCLEKVIHFIAEVTVLINSCLFGFPITRVLNYYSSTEDLVRESQFRMDRAGRALQGFDVLTQLLVS